MRKIKELEAHNEKKKREREARRSKSKPRITTAPFDRQIQQQPKDKQVSSNKLSVISNATKNQQGPIRGQSSAKPEVKKSQNNSILYSQIDQIENTSSKNANKKLQEKDIAFNKKSNRTNIKLAISSVCLAGAPNAEARTQILKYIDCSTCENFVILFKDNIGRFVSVYILLDDIGLKGGVHV